MATRYCGDIRITLTYRDSNTYRCRVYTPDSKRAAWSGAVSPPAVGFGPGVAYDSPAAYDETARAAVAFASNEGADLSPEIETIVSYRCSACGATYSPNTRDHSARFLAPELTCGTCGTPNGLKRGASVDRYYVRRIK